MDNNQLKEKFEQINNNIEFKKQIGQDSLNRSSCT